MDKDRARIKLWLPHLEMVSNYTLEGRILMMPISGKGRSIGNYSECFSFYRKQYLNLKIYMYVLDYNC